MDNWFYLKRKSLNVIWPKYYNINYSKSEKTLKFVLNTESKAPW